MPVDVLRSWQMDETFEAFRPQESPSIKRMRTPKSQRKSKRSVEKREYFNTRILPDELWITIILYLGLPDISSLCAVNRHIHQIAIDEKVWERVMLSTFGRRILQQYTKMYTRVSLGDRDFSWRQCAAIEYFYRRLGKRTGKLYKRGKAVLQSSWSLRTVNLISDSLYYSKQGPEVGLYASAARKQVELHSKLNLTRVTEVVYHSKPISTNGIDMVVFEVRFRNRLSPGHTSAWFGVPGTNRKAHKQAEAWALAIYEHSIACTKWKKICKLGFIDPEVTTSRGLELENKRYTIASSLRSVSLTQLPRFLSGNTI